MKLVISHVLNLHQLYLKQIVNSVKLMNVKIVTNAETVLLVKTSVIVILEYVISVKRINVKIVSLVPIVKYVRMIV